MVETPDDNVGPSAVLLGTPGPAAVVQLWAAVATAPALLGTPCPPVPGRAVPPRPKPAPKGARCSDAVGLGGLPVGRHSKHSHGSCGRLQAAWSSSGHEAGEGSEGEPFPAAGARGGSGAQAVLSVTGVH